MRMRYSQSISQILNVAGQQSHRGYASEMEDVSAIFMPSSNNTWHMKEPVPFLQSRLWSAYLMNFIHVSKASKPLTTVSQNLWEIYRLHLNISAYNVQRTVYYLFNQLADLHQTCTVTSIERHCENMPSQIYRKISPPKTEVFQIKKLWYFS